MEIASIRPSGHGNYRHNITYKRHDRQGGVNRETAIS